MTKSQKAKGKIPITAITGFLGSGKTTLLNYILENNQGLKIGVVVNDYGAINIDAELIAARTDSALELTNGCMCCSLGSLELDEAINQFVTPGSEMDYIIIEASGLAEPADLAVTLREATGRHTKLDSLVAVIDAVNLERNAEQHATAMAQIEYSDFVIVNKTDLVPIEKVEEIKGLVQGINERARIFTASHGEIDVRLLLGQDFHDEQKSIAPHDHGSDHLHDEYSKVSFTSGKSLDPAAFQKFVNEQIPPEIYRAKGFVDLGKKGHGRKYTFQLVGKRAEMTWGDWLDQKPRTELVFIGIGFDEQKLTKLAEATIDANPGDYDPEKQVVLPKREL